MDYELAKQLKEAGFPQKEPNGFVGLMNAGKGDENGRAYFPKLEDLIKECGDGFQILCKDEEGFMCCNWDKTVCQCEIGETISRGNTLEEAVANLYIELNKK